MPVGTQGTVKGIFTDDIKKTIPILCKTPDKRTVFSSSKKGKYGKNTFKNKPKLISFKLLINILLYVDLLFALFL